MSFLEMVRATSAANDSLLVVGLDPDLAELPEAVRGGGPDEELARFNGAIVEQTRDLVCAYKLNLAFYLAAGPAGLEALAATVKLIPAGIPAILDLKCGDIGNTAERYARACYETLGCHAATVNPLMGEDAVAPFLAYPDGCAFVLVLTSNPGAADFERQPLADGRPLYGHVAARLQGWAARGPCGAVVAPVDQASFRELREALPGLPFLVPGVGAQGLDLGTAVRYGVDSQGGLPLINVSRAVIRASSGGDFAHAARAAARGYREEINRHR